MYWCKHFFVLFVSGVFFVNAKAETDIRDTPDSTEKLDYTGYQVLKVEREKTHEILQKLFDYKDYEIWAGNETHFDIFVSREKKDAIKSVLSENKIKFVATIKDVQNFIDNENPPVEKSEFDGIRGHSMTFNSYHRLADIYGYLDYLAKTYPNFVSVGSIGQSVERRNIKFIKISSGKPNAKKFWIDGGIHAREWISPAVTTYIISELVENRQQHFQELEGIDFYIVPVFNPDGYEYSHVRDRMWRKNRSNGYYCQGTDLNRNWGFQWQGSGPSNNECSETYKGRGPFSEPETKSVSNFILNNANNMKAFITFHSFAQVVLIPFGSAHNFFPRDYSELLATGHIMANAIRSIEGSNYRVGNIAEILNTATGSSADWAKGAANIKYSYGIELRDRGDYGFLLPASQILGTGKESMAAIKALASIIVRQSRWHK